MQSDSVFQASCFSLNGTNQRKKPETIEPEGLRIRLILVNWFGWKSETGYSRLSPSNYPLSATKINGLCAVGRNKMSSILSYLLLPISTRWKSSS